MENNGSIVILLEQIGRIVNAQGMTWKQKRQAVLDQATDEDKANLEEFAGWFENMGPIT